MVNLTPEQSELAQELTTLQLLTVLGVMEGKTQRQAYYDAGGKAKSDESADATVSGILSDPKVKAFYDSLMQAAITEAVMTKTEALERLSTVARTNITDVVEFSTEMIEGVDKITGEPTLIEQTVWRVKESAELNELASATIKSVTMTKFGPKVEMYDRLTAIGQLSKMQGWDSASKIDHTTGGEKISAPMSLTKEALEAIAKKLEE